MRKRTNITPLRRVNPIFSGAEALLDNALRHGTMMPFMVELIEGELCAYYCVNGILGWYPVTYEQMIVLLKRRGDRK